MKKAEDYRQHAEECRQLSTRALTTQERHQLQKMAETWESLAKDRESFIGRHPELSGSQAKEPSQAKPS